MVRIVGLCLIGLGLALFWLWGLALMLRHRQRSRLIADIRATAPWRMENGHVVYMLNQEQIRGLFGKDADVALQQRAKAQANR
jgi:hypothetical protein